MASPANSASERLASGILAALDLAIFERLPDGVFRGIGSAPAWLGSILPQEADANALDVADVFPFLESFLAEASAREERSQLMRSDVWTERDRKGQDHLLTAMALEVEGRPVLILDASTDAHQEQTRAMQRAHDAVLESERIERLQRALASLNEELRARNQEVERATRAKSDFLAAMSHEIRTPMNAIVGMSDLLSQTPLSTEQKRYVDVFQRAGENLLTLLNDILDLSKVEAGQMELENVAFDLEDVVAKATEIVQLRAAKKGLTIRYRIAAGVPTRLIGDPGRLRQILINLLGNAMKFTEKGGVEVGVEIDPQSSEPGRLQFAVTDTGIGIAPDKVHVIFEDFVQADSSTTRNYGGTGLGLSISRQFVTLMQGRIWVESTLGVGSTFYFTAKFGLQAVQTPSAGRTVDAAKQAPAAARIAPGLQILLADDSDDNRFLILSYLKGADCSIEIAENGRIAVDMFQPGKFDLVLMDVEMPEMDGYAAVRAIRHLEQTSGAPSTPVLALTAHAFQEAVQRSLDAGFTAHLTKPIRRLALIDAIAAFAPEARAASRPKKIQVIVDPTLEDLIPGYLEKRRRDAAKVGDALKAGDLRPPGGWDTTCEGPAKVMVSPR